MYTQCPECDTIFRVNAAVLRAAQGQVRCGVCEATFDAIRFLTDEIEAGVNAASASRIHFEPAAEAPPVGDPPATESELPAQTSSPFRPSPSLPLVAFEMAEASNEWWATPVSEWPDSGSAPDIQDTSGSLPDEAVSPIDEDDLQPVPVALADADTDTAADDLEEEALESSSWAPSPDKIAAFDAPVTPAIEIDDRDRVRRTRRGERRANVGPWIACGALVLALACQVIDHERERLVTIPTLAPALTAVYAVLGRPLEPRWDLSAYDIREWTATPDAESKTLRLRAKIRNRGRQSQPWPLLRVVLEDRYGGLVARRDFTPAEYLPGHPASPGMMSAGGMIEADLILADPGPEVVGYEIDSCLPHGGEIGCGADDKGLRPE